MRNFTKKSSMRSSGFSLLEVVIAMGMLGLLVGMVFAVAQSSMQLSDAVVSSRNEANNRSAFFEMMRRHFEQLPGNAILHLEYEDAGSHYLSSAIFENVPMAFNWGGRAINSQAVELKTVKRRDGYLDVVMIFYPEKVYDPNEGRRNEKVLPIGEVTILEAVWRFEWRAYDHRVEEWANKWETGGPLPLKMELNVVFAAQEDEQLQVFWITPKKNPESVIQQGAQQQGAPQGGGGGQTPGDGSVPATDPPPTTPRQ